MWVRFQLFGLSGKLISGFASTLNEVAAIMAEANNPWWIIGSAAVALHLERDVGVNDIDILLSVDDARAIRTGLGIAAEKPKPHPLFHSIEYFSWDYPFLPIEFMADFSVRVGGAWEKVCCKTRQSFDIAGSVVYAPNLDELEMLLALFARPKDMRRLALLKEKG
ncbi:MAG: hypothetical protein RL481_1132 [Pseudomonadota bacterium]|jgi:hypothetical protein